MSITDCQYRLGQCRAIGHAAQRNRRELQSRHPSFGPMLEHLQQLLIDRFVRAIGQQAPGLLRRKAEVHCPNLIHIAAATHARVGQGRIRPGADHQVQAWWRVLQQCRQELMHLSFGDLMVVVEDKNEVMRQIQELIAERGAERLRGMLMVLNARKVASPTGQTTCTAATNCVTKRSRSLSFESSVYQADSTAVWASQSARRVVLPKPAGPMTRTSGRSRLKSSCRASRGRETKPGVSCGRITFARRVTLLPPRLAFAVFRSQGAVFGRYPAGIAIRIPSLGREQ